MTKKIYKYRAHLSQWSPEIVKVAIDRETSSSVFIKGKRHAKHSQHYLYCDTFDEAYTVLFNIANTAISRARINLDDARERMKEVERLGHFDYEKEVEKNVRT